MARHPYPIHTIRLRQPLSQEQLSSALDSADEKQTLRGMVLMWLALDKCSKLLAITKPACHHHQSIDQTTNWCWGWNGASNGNMAGSELYQVSDLRLFQHIFFVSYGYQRPTPTGHFWSQSTRSCICQWLVWWSYIMDKYLAVCLPYCLLLHWLTLYKAVPAQGSNQVSSLKIRLMLFVDRYCFSACKGNTHRNFLSTVSAAAACCVLFMTMFVCLLQAP